MKLNTRFIYLALLGFCFFLLFVSFLLEYGFDLKPCPLCLIDRGIVFLLALLFALAWWHNPGFLGRKIYSALAFLFSFTGILTTGRQLWLMHLPPEEVPSCSPSLNYLLDTLPLKEVLKTLFLHSGECAQKQEAFLGLSLPGWTMVAFLMLAIGSLMLWARAKKQDL